MIYYNYRENAIKIIEELQKKFASFYIWNMADSVTFQILFSDLRKYLAASEYKLFVDEKRSTYPDLYGSIEAGSRRLDVHFYIKLNRVWIECQGRNQPCELSAYQDECVKGKGGDFLNGGLESARTYLKTLVDRVMKRPVVTPPKPEPATVAKQFSAKQKSLIRDIPIVTTMSMSLGLTNGFCKKVPENPEDSNKIKRKPEKEEPHDVNHNQETLFSLLNESLDKPMAIFRDREKNANLKRVAQEELQKFKLYGMLLWDRDRDAYIEKTVTKYGTLQDNAGDFFKFMPLFSRAPRRYGEALGGAFNDVRKKIVDDQLYTRTFLSALDISEHSIPYLVVTKSLKANKILLVPADLTKGLPTLIKCLGTIAQGNRPSLLHCQERLFNRFGIRSEIRELGNRNFAQRLINPLTIIMLNDKTGIRAQVESPENLIKQARESLLDFQNTRRLLLDEARNMDHESAEYKKLCGDYENLCTEVLYTAAQTVSDIADDDKYGIPLNVAELDDESRINYDSAVKAMRAIEFFVKDFSPIIIALGKMFENEMNTSMVQYIREELGIPMSEFYRRLYGNGSQNFLVEQVDFNRQKNGRWVAPEIGSTLWVVYNKEQFWNDLTAKYPQILAAANGLSRDLLCRLWHQVCDYRNKAAHPNAEGYSLETLDAMKDVLAELAKYGCFTLMHKLRDKMSHKEKSRT